MAENQREDRRQNQKKNENTAVAINVQELLVSHAADCA